VPSDKCALLEAGDALPKSALNSSSVSLGKASSSSKWPSPAPKLKSIPLSALRFRKRSVEKGAAAAVSIESENSQLADRQEPYS
jgi:hypothetical protein